MEILGKGDKKQEECCTFLLQCRGLLRAGKRGLQTLPLFCFWWLTIDYFFLPHFIIWFNILGQGVLWQDRGWVWKVGVKSFFCKATFCGFMYNDMFLCLLHLDKWRARGESIHTWLHLLLQTLHQSLHSLFIEQSLKCFEMKLSTVLPLPKGERACVPLSKCEAVSLGTR